MLLPSPVFLSSSANHKASSSVSQYLLSELSGNLREDQRPIGSLWPIVSLFTLVALANLRGLLPYVFPGTRHLVITVSISLPLWIGYMVNSWARFPTHILAHLVPLRTPTVLLPFIVLVELVSSLIRPLTLAVRLAANIVAGHLLLVLLRDTIAVKRPLFIGVVSIMLIIILGLSILESAVRLIQAYVFVALQTLYLSEVRKEAAELWGRYSL